MQVVGIDIDENQEIQLLTENQNIFFSDAEIKQEGIYYSIDLEETNSYLNEPEKPMLPVYTQVFTFPFSTKIKDVECKISDVDIFDIDGKIKPTPISMHKISAGNKKTTEKTEKEISLQDDRIYTGMQLYPDKWYDYSITCGLENGKHVIRVIFQGFPIRYNPSDDTIYQIKNLDIKISYQPSNNNFLSSENVEEYDLVIIAPNVFSNILKPLIRHKNKYDMKTMLKTTEDIYNDYEGRDKPEQIKYFIKDAIERWNVSHVLLVGGLNSLIDAQPKDDANQGSKDWYLPVRYSNVYDLEIIYDGIFDPGYLTDLYYSDIYRYNESTDVYEFEDWDSNGNNIFGEWTWKKVNGNNGSWEIKNFDLVDLDPDVYVGRLPCRNIYEVKILVNKIIKYESRKIFKDWFKKIILIAGDTFPEKDDPYFEGEVETGISGSHLEPLGFEVVKLWASNNKLKDVRDIAEAWRRGAGFVHITGHGNPTLWSTHPPKSHEWLLDFFIYDMFRLTNFYKLPIVVAGGCHTSAFNVSLLRSIVDINNTRHTWTGGWPTPECWSWVITRKIGGGAIATIGNTGLGFGSGGSSSPYHTGGWIETRFFENYATEDIEFLGELHSQTISDYIVHFDVVNNFYSEKDRKTVEQWLLIGDPSLKIGGYS